MQGCQTFDNPNPYIKEVFEVCDKATTLMIVPDLRTDGFAIWGEDKGLILLKEYPICLEHEIKHICEGHWHDPNTPNGDYCR